MVALNRSEIELLLCCVRISSNRDRAEQLRALLREDLDWGFLVRTAHHHAVVPLVFWRLSNTCPEAVPTAVLDRLRSDFQANNLRNLSLTRELLRFLNLFEAQGIPAIPYKGPALAAFAYGNLALRQFIDLDILVHKQDVLRAKELLICAGYRPEDRLTRAQEAAFLRCKHERLFRHVADGSMVELHWGIIDKQFSFPLDPEPLWERLDWVPLGGSTVPTLSPEEMLLILCVHGSVHLWERLGWICDVAQLMSVPSKIDWEQVTGRAAALRGERMLFLGLYLASDFLGAPLLEKVWQRVQADSMVKVLAREEWERLYWDIDTPLSISYDLPAVRVSFHLRMKSVCGTRSGILSTQ